MTDSSADQFRETVTDSTIINDPPEDLPTDSQGYVVVDGEQITDGFGTPIKESNVAGLTYLDDHGFHINEEGKIVNDDDTEVWLTIQDRREDVFTPYIHKEQEVALIRDGILSKDALATLLRKSDVFDL